MPVPLMEDKTYRLLLAGLAAAMVLSGAALRLTNRHLKRLDDADIMVNLAAHEISDPKTAASAPVVILGSCEAGGLEDQFNRLFKDHRAYNLATAGGNSLTVLAYFKLALPYHPSHVIAIIAHDALLALPQDTRVTLARPELIEDMIPPNIFAKLLPFCRWQFRARAFLGSPRILFSNEVQRSLEARILRARDLLFGPAARNSRGMRADPYWRLWGDSVAFSADEMRSLLGDLYAYARARGVEITIIMPPVAWISSEQTFDPEAKTLNLALRRYLQYNRIPYLDYEGLFRKHSEFFEDGIHITPQGTKIWAERMHHDIFVHPQQSPA